MLICMAHAVVVCWSLPEPQYDTCRSVEVLQICLQLQSLAWLVPPVEQPICLRRSMQASMSLLHGCLVKIQEDGGMQFGSSGPAAQLAIDALTSVRRRAAHLAG